MQWFAPFFPTFEEQRKREPDLYLLNRTEANVLSKAAIVESFVELSLTPPPDEKDKRPRLERIGKSKIKDTLQQSLVKNGVSLARLKKICIKIVDSKAWTISPSLPDAIQDTDTIHYFTTDRTAEGKKGRGEAPVLWDSNASISEKALICGIESGLPFVFASELKAAEILNGLLFDAEIPEQQEMYSLVKSSALLDCMVNIGRMALEKADPTDNYILISAANGTQFMLSLENGACLNDLQRPFVDKLQKLIQETLIKSRLKTTEFEIKTEDFLEVTEKSDKKTATEKLKAFALIAGGARWKYTKPNGGFGMLNYMQRIDYDPGKGREGGKITGRVSEDYLMHLRNNALSKYIYHSRLLYKIPDNMPNAYKFLVEFSEQKRRNKGESGNIENKLSVLTLLQKSTLPTYESLKKKSQAGQKIIEPFVKSLNYIDDLGAFSWEFAHSTTDEESGKLTDKELYDVYTNYKLFSSLVIVVKWYEEPSYETLLSKKQEQKEKATAAQEPKKKRGRPRKNPQPE